MRDLATTPSIGITIGRQTRLHQPFVTTSAMVVSLTSLQALALPVWRPRRRRSRRSVLELDAAPVGGVRRVR